MSKEDLSRRTPTKSRRKAEKKSIRNFIVDHLQKVIYFVSNLKFWNVFCLLVLLAANFMFHTDSIYLTNNQTPDTVCSRTQSSISNPQLFIDNPAPSSTLTVSVSDNKINLTQTANQNSFYAPSSNTKKISLSDDISAPPSTSPQDTKTQTKSEIFIAILTLMTLIEHIIPERFLRILIRLVRK